MCKELTNSMVSESGIDSTVYHRLNIKQNIYVSHFLYSN